MVKEPGPPPGSGRERPATNPHDVPLDVEAELDRLTLHHHSWPLLGAADPPSDPRSGTSAGPAGGIRLVLGAFGQVRLRLRVQEDGLPRLLRLSAAVDTFACRPLQSQTLLGLSRLALLSLRQAGDDAQQTGRQPAAGPVTASGSSAGRASGD
jgi:hypothetical protein